MGLFTRQRHSSLEKPAAQTSGTHTMPAWLYDLMSQWFVLSGKERLFRQQIIELAQLRAGEAVLDVGCGTGTLAIVAKKRVGATGHVCGIDPSASLLAGARRKAARAKVPIDFQQAGIERLPFPDQSFDLVLNTFVIHHLSDDLKRQGFAEIARVLKPQGRLLIIDFKEPSTQVQQRDQTDAAALAQQFLPTLPALMEDAGFALLEAGELPFQIRSGGSGDQSYGFVLLQKSPPNNAIN